MKLDQLFAQVISAENFDHFSAVEIRAAYITLHADKGLDRSTARRFVYSELIKLVNNGWLRKTVLKKKEITTYIKTDIFNSAEISFERSKGASNVSRKNISTITIQDALQTRLNKYKNELLISYGESTEYKKLCNEFPDLFEELQQKYNDVRELNSRLLGQIKAVENLINKATE